MSTNKKDKKKDKTMNKDITKLQKENDDLKSQIAVFGTELKEMQAKMATTFDTVPTEKDLDRSVQFLSDEYDDLKSFKVKIVKDISRMAAKLKEIEESVLKIEDAIEEIHKYSYQYNIKILGINQCSEQRSEPAKETVQICMNLFRNIGAEIEEYDIDIAHRVPSRNSKFPPPIICKFTRRLAKEVVMGCKKKIRDINPEDLGLTVTGRIGIYDHLTPHTQALFNRARQFQKDYNFSFCWIKNSNVLLKENEDSTVIRVTCPEVLERLTESMISR